MHTAFQKLACSRKDLPFWGFLCLKTVGLFGYRWGLWFRDQGLEFRGKDLGLRV